MKALMTTGAVTAALMTTTAPMALADSVSLFCSGSGSEYEMCSSAANAWAEATGNEVRINRMPASWDEALPLYQQLLAAQSPDIDVMIVDVIWVGILKEHLLDLSTVLPAADIDQHFDVITEAGTVDGRLVAMPWYTDTGLMFYRTDLLEKYDRSVPTTWTELTETARIIVDGERAAGNGDMWGYVWQGNSYEGLTCDAIEWVASSGGGSIIAEDGTITINNPEAAAAIELAASWIGTISPRGVLEYDEESSRGVFELGNAVFHRNWSYVWGTSQGSDGPIDGVVGVMELPVGADGQTSSGCMGTAHMGVSAYSQHPEAAASLLAWMTGHDEQKRRAIEGAYNPTVPALYEDPEVLAAIPFLADAMTAFDESVSRPSAVTGGDYNQVSTAFYTAVHAVLSGEDSATDALAQLESDLGRIKERGGW